HRTPAHSSMADPRTHQPPLSRLPKCVESACILLSPRGGWTYITSRYNGAALAQMGHCSRDPGAEMLTVPRIKALPTADSCLRRCPRSNCYRAPADAVREAPCFGPSTTTSAPVFTRL